MQKTATLKNVITGYYLKPSQAFGINDNIITENVVFINQTKILFISGCNLVVYDIVSSEMNFIMRNSPLLSITSMSVGQKGEKDIYVCLGEYSNDTNKKQISVISLIDNKIQYVLSKNDAKEQLNWRIIFARILKNSSNCVSIAKRDNSAMQSRLTFWKYTQELFVSEATIEDDVRYCSFNPKNTYELILCGKNYLRLWNVFINQGILREHPQRFLKNKQEKEHTFINIEFFEQKSFMFIAATLENVIFIIEGFNVIAEINTFYSKENIIDLNLQNQIVESDEAAIAFVSNNPSNENNKTLNASSKNLMNQNSFTAKGLESRNKNPFIEDSSSDLNNINKALNRINKTKLNFFSNDDTVDASYANCLRSVKIIGKNQILISFQNESVTYIYKIDKDLKNAVIKKEEGPNLDESQLKSKMIQEEIKVERIASNIKQILNVSINEDGSRIIYLVEVYGKTDRAVTNYRLLLFNKKGHKIVFEKELFRNFIYKHKIKKFGINEKKKIFFTLNENNTFRCFDFKNPQFYLQHSFTEEPLEVVSCPNNNLIAISFQSKFSLFLLLKDKLAHFMDFDIFEPNAKFSEKGEVMALTGCNPHNKIYSILFFDTLNFNILYCIEDIKSRAKKMLFLDNDRLFFMILENNLIRGFNLNFDFLSINLMNRLKDRSKSVDSTFINLFYKHFPKGDYLDFDYDYRNDLLVAIMKGQEKVF